MIVNYESATPILYSCLIDFVGLLERFIRNSTFWFGLEFPTGCEMLGGVWAKYRQNVEIEKTLVGRALPCDF